MSSYKTRVSESAARCKVLLETRWVWDADIKTMNLDEKPRIDAKTFQQPLAKLGEVVAQR